MKVTEHYGNFPPDWQLEEVEALMDLVKVQIKEQNDKSTQMFYAKIYGKLLAMKHDVL